MSAPLQVGDCVAYARGWLTSTQAHDLGAARGVVTGVNERVVGVEWGGDAESNMPHHNRVLATNLVRVYRLHLEAP